MNDKREYRSFDLNIEKRAEGEQPSFLVEGYASTYKPYVLFSEDGVDYSEVIDRHAFDNADFSDCVFRVDHEGQVFARVSNKTVKIDIDDHGLHHVTDLSKTAKARSLYEDIEAGIYPQMSFAFTVREDAYDYETHTRTILSIDKVYDIAPVTWPANPDTELDVKTRDYFNGVIEAEKAERLDAEKRQRDAEKLKLRLKLMEV